MLRWLPRGSSIDSLGLGAGIHVQRFLKYFGEVDSARFVTVLYNKRSGGGNKLPNFTRHRPKPNYGRLGGPTH